MRRNFLFTAAATSTAVVGSVLGSGIAAAAPAVPAVSGDTAPYIVVLEDGADARLFATAQADRLGLDLDRTLEALQAGAAASFMLGNRGPRMLQAWDDEGAEVLSRLDIFVKDMGIVGAAARRAGLPAPLAAAAEQSYLLAQAQGLGESDDSSVIRISAPARRT